MEEVIAWLPGMMEKEHWDYSEVELNHTVNSHWMIVLECEFVGWPASVEMSLVWRGKGKYGRKRGREVFS